MICPSCGRDTCCPDGSHCGHGEHRLDSVAITKAANALERAQQKEWFGTDVVGLVDEINEVHRDFPRIAEFLLKISEDYRTQYEKHYNRQ